MVLLLDLMLKAGFMALLSCRNGVKMRLLLGASAQIEDLAYCIGLLDWIWGKWQFRLEPNTFLLLQLMKGLRLRCYSLQIMVCCRTNPFFYSGHRTSISVQNGLLLGIILDFSSFNAEFGSTVLSSVSWRQSKLKFMRWRGIINHNLGLVSLGKRSWAWCRYRSVALFFSLLN